MTRIRKEQKTTASNETEAAKGLGKNGGEQGRGRGRGSKNQSIESSVSPTQTLKTNAGDHV
ncbi:hypothetical protein RhiirA5_429450 [Rhizophagus irregularis]|uniref:Uncharacterized protein n=1 Tax=Rhizophagus irregularis TaxID=588596 RepID=A0A2N0NYE8_9GLOM|nr:hypothetical protein RhiirA5_429450 [Rhizophagus irregularis]